MYTFLLIYLNMELSINIHVPKEIKLVNPKGNQPGIFTGMIDTEAEALLLWPPDMKSQLIGKDPDTGNDSGREEKGMTEDEMVGSLTRWT